MTRCVTARVRGSTTRPFSSPGKPSRHTAAAPIASVTSAISPPWTSTGNLLGPAFGHRREGPPRRLRVHRLVWIAVERVEHHGVGAERAQLPEVACDLLDRAVAG